MKPKANPSSSKRGLNSRLGKRRGERGLLVQLVPMPADPPPTPPQPAPKCRPLADFEAAPKPSGAAWEILCRDLRVCFEVVVSCWADLPEELRALGARIQANALSALLYATVGQSWSVAERAFHVGRDFADLMARRVENVRRPFFDRAVRRVAAQRRQRSTGWIAVEKAWHDNHRLTPAEALRIFRENGGGKVDDFRTGYRAHRRKWRARLGSE